MLRYSPSGCLLDKTLELRGPPIPHMLNGNVVMISEGFCQTELMKHKGSTHCWSHKADIKEIAVILIEENQSLTLTDGQQQRYPHTPMEAASLLEAWIEILLVLLLLP